MAVSGLDLQTLKKEVRNRLVEPSEGFFSDEEITRWINLAQVDIVRKTGVLKAVVTGDSLASVKEYSLPADFLNLLVMSYKIAGKWTRLKYYTIEEYWEKDDSIEGIPEYFSMLDSSFFLFPKPKDAITDVYRLVYLQAPQKMEAATDMPFSNNAILYPYHELIVLYATARGKEKEGELEEAIANHTQYQNELAFMRGELRDSQKHYRMKRSDYLTVNDSKNRVAFPNNY